MPAPKSIVKIKKGGVEYTSNVEAEQYYIHELSRAAMRDVGKYVRKMWQELYDSKFTKHTGHGRKATSVKVIASASTTAPRVQIGLKSGKVDGFYAYFQEFGTSKQQRLGLLEKAVKDNVKEIIEIESKYLSAMEDELQRMNYVDEKEFDEED